MADSDIYLFPVIEGNITEMESLNGRDISRLSVNKSQDTCPQPRLLQEFGSKANFHRHPEK